MKENIKIAPNSKESEMMVLGCMLTSLNSLNTGADLLEESDFYFIEHSIIFRVMKQFYKNDHPVDLHLLCEELKRQELLKNVGGISYITTLAQYAGTSAHFEQYAEIVKDKAILRRMINAADLIEKNALEDPIDVKASLDEAQQLLFKISQDTGSKSGVLIGDILSGSLKENKLSFLDDLQKKQERYLQFGDQGVEIGLTSYFKDLDKMIHGLGNSNLIILAARPAMGKTALAINIAENVCFEGGHPVGIFSLEMSAEQLVQRIICSQSGVFGDKIKKGNIAGHEYQKIVETINKIQNSPMIIDDQPGLKITDLRVRARRMKEAYGVKLIVIDYLQLITSGGGKKQYENRQTEVSEISKTLKNLARELNIPVICLSQLSRKVEERESNGKRPVMSDLRDSGSIEQDADVVIFLYRGEYYNADTRPGIAELIVCKNRHGGIGTIEIAFQKQNAKFSDQTFQKLPGHYDKDDDDSPFFVSR